MKILNLSELSEKLDIKPANLDNIKEINEYTLLPLDPEKTKLSDLEYGDIVKIRTGFIMMFLPYDTACRVVPVGSYNQPYFFVAYSYKWDYFQYFKDLDDAYPESMARALEFKNDVISIWRPAVQPDIRRITEDTLSRYFKDIEKQVCGNVSEKLDIKPVNLSGIKIQPPATGPRPESRDELKELINEHCSKHGHECSLNFIDVSRVTDMEALFNGSIFNGDISGWDVSNVKDMSFMFYGSRFNGDISDWDVSNVETMNGMFRYAAFDGDLSKWRLKPNCVTNWMFENSKLRNTPSRWPKGAII